MSTTPRTDAATVNYYNGAGAQVPADFARELERENAELRAANLRMESDAYRGDDDEKRDIRRECAAMSELFPATEGAALSPRLQWMQRHGVMTYRIPSDGTWIAGVAKDAFGRVSEAEWFAAETGSWGETRIGVASTEDEALADLALKHGIRLWNESEGAL